MKFLNKWRARKIEALKIKLAGLKAKNESLGLAESKYESSYYTDKLIENVGAISETIAEISYLQQSIGVTECSGWGRRSA